MAELDRDLFHIMIILTSSGLLMPFSLSQIPPTPLVRQDFIEAPDTNQHSMIKGPRVPDFHAESVSPQVLPSSLQYSCYIF